MYRSSQSWEPTPPFKAFLVLVAVVALLALLTGCSFLDRLTNPQPTYDPRTVLERGQILEVNIRTHRLLKSPHLRLEDFRCPNPPMMCSGSGVTMDCSCP